jgi:hypothetical protein
VRGRGKDKVTRGGEYYRSTFCICIHENNTMKPTKKKKEKPLKKERGGGRVVKKVIHMG